jgi:hypothetical protein
MFSRVRKLTAISLFTLLAAFSRVAAPQSPANPANTETAAPTQVQVVPWRSDQFGRYYALVIGIDDYEYLRPGTKATTSIDDANEVAKILFKKYAFDATLVRNATRTTMFAELARLRHELTDSDNLLIFYAGRGHIDETSGLGYWWPSDAKPNDPASWIANAEVSDQLKAMKAAHVLVVAESCYTGTEPYRSQAKPDGNRHAWLQRLAQARSRTALTSGELQPVADGHTNGQSPFASALLAVLRKNEGVIDTSTMVIALKPALSATQTPSYGVIRGAGDGGGDFLFVARDQ